MSRFYRIFSMWFVSLVLCFTAVNLADPQSSNLKPFHSAGFPFTYAAWGYGIDEFFDWPMLILNASIAVVIAGLVAGMLAWLRCRTATVSQNATPPQN